MCKTARPLLLKAALRNSQMVTKEARCGNQLGFKSWFDSNSPVEEVKIF
jgi:hypothetical protein